MIQRSPMPSPLNKANQTQQKKAQTHCNDLCACGRACRIELGPKRQMHYYDGDQCKERRANEQCTEQLPKRRKIPAHKANQSRQEKANTHSNDVCACVGGRRIEMGQKRKIPHYNVLQQIHEYYCKQFCIDKIHAFISPSAGLGDPCKKKRASEQYTEQLKRC